MRRWIWGALAIAALVALIGVMMPQQRAAAPEVPQTPAPGSVGMPQGGGQAGEDAQQARMREAADKLQNVELIRIEQMEGGVIAVDARYTGPEEEKPTEQAEWNRLAKELANSLARTPANIMTVRVRLYDNETLRAEEVTTRSE